MNTESLLKFRAIIPFLLAIACSGTLSADPISLDNYPSVSPSIFSYVVAGEPSYGSDIRVNSLPFVTVAISDPNGSSILTNDLTTSGLNFGFSESSVSADAFAQGSIIFQAGSGSTFSISGSLALTSATGTGGGAGLETRLQDLTQGQYVYDYAMSVSQGPGSLVLDTSGGSLSGSLTSGDVYVFLADESTYYGMNGPASGTGNIDINFAQAVPEPSTYSIVLGGMALLFFYRGHKRDLRND